MIAGDAVRGLPAWLMHRGYHVLVVPGWERKWRVLANRVLNVLLRREMASLEASTHPRHAFEAATRPGSPRRDLRAVGE